MKRKRGQKGELFIIIPNTHHNIRYQSLDLSQLTTKQINTSHTQPTMCVFLPTLIISTNSAAAQKYGIVNERNE
jgi:hypothetical protein